MRFAAIIWLRLRTLFRRGRVEGELNEELLYHLDRQMDEYVSTGMAPEEALLAARRALGDITQRQEECRDMRGVTLIDNAAMDLRYAFRQLRKSPGFALAAVFVLGLGVAAAVTIFSFVDAALIRPLPYKDQSRLVSVFEASATNQRSWVSYLNFRDWQRSTHSLNALEAYALNGSETGTRVSPGFFRALGVTPALGRDFQTDDDQQGSRRTALITYAAWQRRFGGDPHVIGRTVTLDWTPTTIIGVLPREFHFALYGGAEFWGLLRASDGCEQQRGCRSLMTIARLNDGVSLESATAEMSSVVQHLRDEYPDANRGVSGASLVPLRELIVGDVRPILVALLAGAALLLLIACVNVMALLLARSDRRQREIAIRGALGASRARLARQFAAEGLVLAILAGSVALLLAAFGVRSLPLLVPPGQLAGMPYLRGLQLSPATVAFCVALLLFATALFSIVPIGGLPRWGRSEGLTHGARGSGEVWRRFGRILVTAEIAIAMVLMAGAGLLAKSVYLMLHLDLGFDPAHLVAVSTSWAPGRYETEREKIALGRRIVERVSALPGIRSVALSNAPTVDSDWGTGSFHMVGRPDHGENNEVMIRHISASYFATLQARLLQGRCFRDDEDVSKPLVAIVNRALAGKYFGGEDPVGRRIYWDWQPKSQVEIVGLVEDVREGALAGLPVPVAYVPYDQVLWDWPAIIVRLTQRRTAVLTELTRAIQSVDPSLAISEPQSISERVSQSPAAALHRECAIVAGAFAAIAFILGVVGLYSVIAYSVGRRTREIGIRMALGAEKATVLRLILKEGGWVIALGIGSGLVCSLGAAILMRTLLFGISAWDLPTLGSAASLLTIAALSASYIPARRASSVNAVEALRVE
jgi:predicted permease